MTEKLRWLTQHLSRLPIVGPAFTCRYAEFSRSFKEIVAGLFWSMLPIWVGTFAGFVRGSAFSFHGFVSALSPNIAGGELFIYAAAFLAPIYWMIYSDPPGAGRFPSTLAHGTLTAIITVFSAIAFEMQRSGQIADSTILHRLAIIFFWLALALTYLATLYHNHRLPNVSPEEMRSQQDQFMKQYREHRQ